MVNWTVPPLWQDGECWIMGGGPSVPRLFDVPEEITTSVMSGKQAANAYSPYFAPLHNKHIIGVNNAYQIGDWLDAVFFGDCGWYVVHRLRLAVWPKMKVTCCDRFAAKKEQESDGIKFLLKDRIKRFGISDNPTTVVWNSNSGAAAISLAAHLGVKRIILLGFDMCLDANKISHWHGSHHNPVPGHAPARRPPPPPFARHMKGFDQIAEDAKRMNIEIVNASPISAITQFPKVPIKDLL